MKKFTDINVVFDYNINDDERTIYEGAVLVNVTGKELAKIAELFEANSGHPVEFDSLPTKFVGKIQDAAIRDYEKAVGLEEFECDIDCWADINNILPPNLIHEIEQHDDNKCISVEYTAVIEGKKVQDTAKISIPVDDFYKLAGYQLELHIGYTDFDWLKERDEEMCSKIVSLVKEYAIKQSASNAEVLIDGLELKNCPSEILQYLDCPDYSFFDY